MTYSSLYMRDNPTHHPPTTTITTITAIYVTSLALVQKNADAGICPVGSCSPDSTSGKKIGKWDAGRVKSGLNWREVCKEKAAGWARVPA